MRDRDLYAQILHITAPWTVSDVELDDEKGDVTVHVEAVKSATFTCPECGAKCTRYDSRERRWRHLDTCQYRTILVAQVPRIQCKEHGVRQVDVPWAEAGSPFTALFEAIVIDWLKEASVSAVSRRLGITWDQVDGIMARAVRRGLARREVQTVRSVGVDETSYQRRQSYVTMVTDLETGVVLHVADGRKKASLDEFFEKLSPEQRESIEVVAMDMWKPFISSTKGHVPDAERKIAFDKFHVAKHLGDALDRVRRREHRALLELGDVSLTGTKYLWLRRADKLDEIQEGVVDILRKMGLKTGRAWAIKEAAMQLWQYVRRGWAEKAWKRWISWAVRSRLQPMKDVANMIRKHLWGIVNAIVLHATNAGSESTAAKIQRVKRMACGFRNRTRFRNAILFHLGGLDLYPAAVSATHTDS